jgi:hypothetical protein
MQVDRCDLFCGEMDAEVTIFAEWPQSNVLAEEGFWHFPEVSLEADIGLGRPDPAHNIAGGIVNSGQAFGHRPGTERIATGRDIEVESLMGPLEVISWRQRSKAFWVSLR